MNKKIIFLVGATVFLLVLSAILPASAQIFDEESVSNPQYPTDNGATSWMKTYGPASWNSFFSSVKQIDDGNYMATGVLNDDLWLVKINQDGSKAWDKTFGGLTVDVGSDIEQTTDGGFIIVGMTAGSTFYDGNIWLIKTNKYGVEQWNKVFEGEYKAESWSVEQTSDGGYIILGTEKNQPGSDDYSDIWLIKTDSNGDIQWDKIISRSDEDDAANVQQTTDGGYILTASIGTFLGEQKALVLKLDSEGNEVWEKIIEDSEQPRIDARYVQQTSDGGYIVLIEKFEEWSDWYLYGDIILVKLDENGETVWQETYSKIVGAYCGSTVKQTSDGGYIITGLIQFSPANVANLFLIKTNANGKKMWERGYGSSTTQMEAGFYCEQTSDGGYIIAGCIVTNPYLTAPDWNNKNWLIKTNEEGAVSRTRTRSINPIVSEILSKFPILQRLLAIVGINIESQSISDSPYLEGPDEVTSGGPATFYICNTDNIDAESFTITWNWDPHEETTGPYEPGYIISHSHTWSSDVGINVLVMAKLILEPSQETIHLEKYVYVKEKSRGRIIDLDIFDNFQLIQRLQNLFG